MEWVAAAKRRSGRLHPIDEDDDELPINGFACDAVILAFAINCPACGAFYQIRARDPRRRIFNRNTQRFRCGSCHFSKPVYRIVDCGFAPEG